MNNEKLKKKDYEKEKKRQKKEILRTKKIIEKEIQKINSLFKNSIEYQELQKKKIQDIEVLQINLNNIFFLFLGICKVFLWFIN